MSELLAAALGYTERGWRVFPLHGIVNGLCTCGSRECSSPGKHPLVRRGLHEATTDQQVVDVWWRRWRSANIGIATGVASGIVVIDVDLPSAMPSLGRLIELELPRTLTGLTGGGGIHLFYSTQDSELGNSAAGLPGHPKDLPGIDLRGNGGYVVAPPSIHRIGPRYEWLDDRRTIAPAPEWLKSPGRVYVPVSATAPARLHGHGTAYGRAALNRALASLRVAPVGQRNHQLNRSAFAIAQLVAGGELLEAPARAALSAEALRIGLTEHESNLTIDSGMSAGVRYPRVAPHRST